MATTFKHTEMGEQISVSNIKKVSDGRYFFTVRNAGCGRKFFNRNVCFLNGGEGEFGGKKGTFLELREGWEAVDEPKARKPRTPKAKASAEPAEPTPTPAPTEPQAEPAVEPIIEPEPIVEPTTTPTPANVATLAAMAGAKAKNLAKKYGEMAGDIIEATAEILGGVIKGTVDEEQVVAIVKKHVNALGTTTIVLKTAAGIVKKMQGVFHEKFNVFRNLVNAKKPVYFYGPAGCGKSYMAKQIADSLGLDYYETSQAMFAHELKGYGNAQGEFVPTAFYRAFAFGGLFFLDEVDASAPEALVVLNNAIANKRFDFPVIGNVEAHENFRVIAAGNTRMTGATLAYTARQCQDTSFKNRFFFELVGYDKRIEMAIAGGDAEIVEFAHDLRAAARKTGILQLCSYRQIEDLATLQECVENDDAHLLRGSVLQEKEVDEANILYNNLEHKSNRWAKAMKKCIEDMKKEEVW